MGLSPNFVNVTVNLPAVGVAAQSFNMGLIVGASTVISAGTRVKTYTSLAAMITDGFSNSSPEYLAAANYFAAPSRPNIVAIGRRASGETSLAALQACRAANTGWYAAYDTASVDGDQAANAAYFETLTAPFSQYFFQSSTSAIKAGTGGNLFATLKAALYSRTHGMFTSNAYGVASIMGYAMGQASNLANSQFTLKFKTLPGVTPETLTETQVTAIEGNYGNVYVTRNANMYEQGQNFSGEFFDEVLGLDMLVNGIFTNATNLLLQNPSQPQTDEGVQGLLAVISQACDTAVTRGFLAPGKWTGAPILGLNNGDYLTKGYLVLAASVNSQSDADRQARIAPPIYVCIKEAGAIHSTVIQVNVNR